MSTQLTTKTLFQKDNIKARFEKLLGENGRGTLELRTEFGKGFYRGDFLNGEFHGKGRLEIPAE